MSRNYGDKEVIGDSACPSCKAQGRDSTSNHLMHWRHKETLDEWVYCNHCGHHEMLTPSNKDSYEGMRQVSRVLTPEEIQSVLDEIAELPILALESRDISKATAERFAVRCGLSSTDGSTVISHFYPKTHNMGELQGYKVRSLDPKYFFSKGGARESDLFGVNQARKGDVFTGKLFIFEDELSAMSGFECLCGNTKSTYKPAVVSLPDGSGSAIQTLARNRTWVESFKEIVICMDADEAGDEAVKEIRSVYPNVKIARIPKGLFVEGKQLKDANDLMMNGKSLDLFNLLRYTAIKESPAEAVSVSDCIEEALKKPEWGFSWPWNGLTQMTYGLSMGELVGVGGGTGSGKTLIAHEMAAHYINVHKMNVGVFMLEENVGTSVKNIAGKSANTPFHLPDLDYDPDHLRKEAMKYEGKLFLYNNYGQNEWDNIKQCMRFWVVQNQCRLILLDNITSLVSHLSPSEINTEVSRISSELAGLCQELNFTCMVFSHLNPPSSGDPHENGGMVKEVQFTGSRALMRWSQLLLGFERNKQASGNGKNLSMIRLMKDRKFGRTGLVYTKYIPETGRLLERPDDEVNKEAPFTEYQAYDESDEQVY